ncbi:DUF1036 domain-containing protein [Oceanicola sp. D3]|uniref:DUF1036 domain-containing protein n=1 Tax=Oceanicola sp. D3 TaxID=2587163 RepID=UPI00111E7EBC|nr:DUF1036 domain-containing protein [Oceanicola sp. D3]QDC09178.1 DUF1036 domain-containing protein [Oceanicola sp. D3]
MTGRLSLINTSFAAAICVAGATISTPARAEFAVCNQSFDVINVAIAQSVGGQFHTEGWWTIGTNQCANVIKNELSNRYIYVYATDVFGQPILDGTVSMCIGAKAFEIDGIENCWERGHKAAMFHEVDTQATVRWTLFVTPPGGG